MRASAVTVPGPGLDGERGQRGEPSLDGAQVERVELPLDLDGVVLRARLSLPWHRTPCQATAGPREPPTGRAIAAIATGAAVVSNSVARRAMTAELPTPTEVVQAAGGLVVRRQDGTLEIVVVHRPAHQDWSFPKGKLEAGETFELAALREVREETGMACRLLRFIGHTEYFDRKGRPKAVAYWVMAAEGGSSPRMKKSTNCAGSAWSRRPDR